ncbi:hypothetical protein BRC85_02915 [Halobacteriales archaeon QS_1_69_70]|nr:MAG: hypothetical protein BRC85_02915 [Halobacteriales archaeon QS_1_69_70]
MVGDRYGAIVLLAAVATYLLCWRVGILITDTYTVANTLVAVADGHLFVDRAVYGPGLRTPGMGLRDGQFYGRNYGQVMLALPVLAALEAVAAVASLRVALAALWGLSIVGLARLVGREVGRPALGAYAGSGFAIVAFAAAVHGATPIEPAERYLIALQLQTMGAAALVGVFVYRLLTRAYGTTVGVAAGLATALATPVGVWAQFPKRHVLVTLCAVGTAYLLYRSREDGGVDTRYRALAYVPVGVAAWVSAAEGAVLLVALLVVDVPTGGRDVRSIAAAGATAVVAALPMVVTNYLVTGNAGEPPRTLSAGGSGSLAERGSTSTGADGGEASGASGDAGGGSADPTAAGDTGGSETLDAFVGAVEFLFELLWRGLRTLLREPETLFVTFVRGGYVAGVAERDAGEAIRLTVLEAMPLAAGLVAVPVVAARLDLRERAAAFRRRPWPRPSALRTVDAFAVVYTVALLLVYLPRLPVHASLTVRYLLACYPMAVYGLARLPSVRRVLRERTRLCAATVASALLVGGQLLVLYQWAIDATMGEAVQTHALVGLATAGLLAAWAVADGLGWRRDRLGAVALGLAAAAGAAFVLLAGLWHFAFVGPRALPLW